MSMKLDQKRESGLICAKLRPEAIEDFFDLKFTVAVKSLRFSWPVHFFSLSVDKIDILKVLQKRSGYFNSKRN